MIEHVNEEEEDEDEEDEDEDEEEEEVPYRQMIEFEPDPAPIQIPALKVVHGSIRKPRPDRKNDYQPIRINPTPVIKGILMHYG